MPVRRSRFLPFAVLMLLVLLTATCVRQPPSRENYVLDLACDPEPLPSAALAAGHLGAFRLEGAWRMRSHHSWFGSWSGLTALAPGRLLAESDQGYFMWFAPPGAPPALPLIAPIRSKKRYWKASNDAEALTSDRATGRVWVAWETSNAITGFERDMTWRGSVRPEPMRTWPSNSGPEAFTRLADGRFIALKEGSGPASGFTRHKAVLFDGDPLDEPLLTDFYFVGPALYRPTDMVQIPDGRVLILMRRLVWPFPPRFDGLILVADPNAIRLRRRWTGTIAARLAPELNVDNFEGIAVEPQADGRLTVWLVSDANGAVIAQRSLLWKLSVDPRQLPAAPQATKKAHGNPERLP